MINDRKEQRSGTLRIKTERQLLKGTKTSRGKENYQVQDDMVDVKINPERTRALKGNKPK